jgi:hypothetical protein
MDDQILAIDCLCTDFLTAPHQAEDCQHNMTAAEVMTTGHVAMVFVGGNFEPARALLGTSQYTPMMLSRRRLNRRLHLFQDLFVTLFHCLEEIWKELKIASLYVIDSCPVVRVQGVSVIRSRRHRVAGH